MTDDGGSNLDGLVDLAALGSWMDAQGMPPGEFAGVTRLTGGTQNVLVRFERGGQTYVLRRGPRHLRPKTNANLIREARVLGALTGRGLAAPALIAACADESVLGGASFFLMEAVTGFSPANGLPKLHAGDAQVRHQMGLSAVERLAELGAVDHEAVGLGDFGQPDGFLERQVPRWLAELASYDEQPGYPGVALPGLDQVVSWLDEHRPAAFRPGIMHGDFHLANLMFEYDGPGIAAIVDWEMATIGDPLLDLGWLLATWPTSDNDPVSALASEFAAAGGLATRRELVERYAAGSTRALTAIDWYAVLACFKLGIVLEGTYARACAGKTDRGIGELFHSIVLALLQRAHGFIDEGI